MKTTDLTYKAKCKFCMDVKTDMECQFCSIPTCQMCSEGVEFYLCPACVRKICALCQEKIPVDEQEVCEYCTVNMCTDCSVNVSEDEKGPVICVDCDDMGFQAIVKGEIPRLHYGDYNDGTL